MIPEYLVTDIHRQDCGGWAFCTIQARLAAMFATYCARETDATGWFTLRQLKSA